MELDFRLFIEIVGAVGLLGGLMWGAIKLIDYQISEPLAVLKSISRLLRPTVLFDENGAILHDQGAMEFIAEDGIQVKTVPFGGSPPQLVAEIRLRPKQVLTTAPLLECLDDDAEITVSHGDGAEWVYCLAHAHMFAFESSPPQIQPHRFRFEILL